MAEQKRGRRFAKYVPDYVVFDLETTGISVTRDDIIEISAVKVRGGEVVDSFSTLVNPGRTIPYGATTVNGITDDMVAEAPRIEQALSGFLTFAGNDILVGHNIHSFDMKFVYNAAASLWDLCVDNDYIDTLYMSRSCLPQLPHHRLVDIAAYFNISTEGAHRALNDCVMNQKCFEALGKIQQTLEVQVCPKCGGELQRRKGRFGEFFGCCNYPVCRYTKNIK